MDEEQKLRRSWKACHTVHMVGAQSTLTMRIRGVQSNGIDM